MLTRTQEAGRLPPKLTPLGGKRGELCFRRVLPKLQTYPAGSIIMLNLKTAAFIAGAGADELKVISRFCKKFGGRAPARIFRLVEDAHGNKQADWLYRL